MSETSETMKDYEAELEQSFRKLSEGDIVKGTVISVDEKEVTVDLVNYYASGVIAAEDYSRNPGFILKEGVHVGDEVLATVTNTDDHGNVRLSKVEASDVVAWDKLKAMMDSKEVIDVVVNGAVKGGAVAYVEDIRGFIPGSKLSLGRVEDATPWLGKTVQVQVIDVDKENKKLVLSARDVLISKVKVGYVSDATVESLQPYGAFVKLDNGMSGLVHISQIARTRIAKPSDVLAVGDTVKVKVINIKDGKLSLSMKDVEGAAPREPEEEKVEIPVSGEEATTNLGDLFKNLKLS